MTKTWFAAGACILALAAPTFAQGNSGNAPGHGGNAPGNSGNAPGHSGGAPGQQGAAATAPPSRNELAPLATVDVPVAVSATPIAWIDDASLLDEGTVALSLSVARWRGAGVSEVDAPVVNAAMGLAPRVQLSASVPRSLGGSDPSGATAGVGTSFFGAKLQLWSDAHSGVKLAVSPTLQLLGEGVAAALGPNEARARWGLPLSAEIGRGAVRLYGGGGYFSPSIWFTGAAVALQASPKLTINGGVSKAWRRAPEGVDVAPADRDRKEISGGAAYVFAPHIVAFGSVGRTFATLDENGAGTTFAAGVSVWFSTVARP